MLLVYYLISTCCFLITHFVTGLDTSYGSCLGLVSYFNSQSPIDKTRSILDNFFYKFVDKFIYICILAGIFFGGIVE